jgi:2-octaprenyl-6-methoxyphenol hydroxylase
LIEIDFRFQAHPLQWRRWAAGRIFESMRAHMSRADISRTEHVYDVAVVGTGPSGLVAALACAHIGADVVAIGPAPTASRDGRLETRTAALLASSIDLLKALGVWDRLASEAAPLEAIRIVDASDSPLRAPDVEFKAAELGLESFGYNIANTVLVDTLYAKARELLPKVIPANVSGITIEGQEAVLTLNQGTQIRARLVAGADGRRSICRTSAEIGMTERRYDQLAIATSFRHTLPHRNVSTELHREHGSITTVPLTDAHASSLIWIGSPAEMKQLMQRDDAGFIEALSHRLGDTLGAISDLAARAAFPVAGLSADRLGAGRIVLLGEAAHILPPIGAQGLNLGFRDAASLADCVAEALNRGSDPGGKDVMEAYAEARRLDIMTRTLGVDLLSRSLLTSLPPLQAARGIVLYGLNALAPLRRAVMRLGLAPPTELPSLMRPGQAEHRASS